MIDLIYNAACPNCGGPLTSSRASKGMLCSSCEPEFSGVKVNDRFDLIQSHYSQLLNSGKLLGFWEIQVNVSELKELTELFKSLTGFEPRSIQKYWLYRMVEGESFTLSAPTGMGKTTTLIVYSAYQLLKGQRALYVVPSSSLRDQVVSKLKAYLNIKEEPERFRAVTVNYLTRNTDELRNFSPNLVVVDDADALLKSGKSTDSLIKVLGIDEETYRAAIELIRLKTVLGKFQETERVKELLNKLNSRNLTYAQLLVASATLKPKGIKQRALRLLLKFDPTNAQVYMRNIIDAYTGRDLVKTLSKLEGGTLILVSRDYGQKTIKALKDELENRGYRVALAVSGRKFLEKFSEGKTDILIGSASYYGVAVRGIDEPKRLYNVVFYGVPKTRLKLADYFSNPLNAIRVLSLEGQMDPGVADSFLRLTQGEITAIRLALIKGGRLTGRLEELRAKAEDLRERALDLVRNALNTKESLEINNALIVKEKGDMFVYIPDAVTYIQGSGRSSRLTPYGLTLGLTVTLIDSEPLYWLLVKKLRRMGVEINPRRLEDLDLDAVKISQIESREGKGKEVDVKTALIVVESPIKAKTITRLFNGSGPRQVNGVYVYDAIIPVGDRILVSTLIATRGHLFDLTVDGKGLYGIEFSGNEVRLHYEWIKRCKDCGRAFTSAKSSCPYCGSENVISSSAIGKAIQRLAVQVDEVYIATDPDTEGEKIAFDVFNLVRPLNPQVFRVEYHEVTRNGILGALSRRREINVNLVNAQLVRRVEDRLIGFELSRALKNALGDVNNGSGRVQGPVLKWLVARYKEYLEKRGYVANVVLGNYRFTVFLGNEKREKLRVKVRKLGERTGELNPLPPFTTDELLQVASTELKFPPHVTMRLAQDLFEMGLITYHRTDSTHVSAVGISIAQDYLKSKGLEADFVPRKWGNEGTHEAIRPTSVIDAEGLFELRLTNRFYATLTGLHVKLYDLIFRRFVASQMRTATARFSRFEIEVEGVERREVELLTTLEGGFSKLYALRTFSVPEGEFEIEVKPYKASAVHLPDYAEIIRKMKENNIGRPSTYAKTIQSIIRHGYAVESKRSKKLVVTRRGINAFTVLSSRFSEFIDEKRTADLLNKIDMIAKGEASPEEAITGTIAEVLSASSVLPSDSYNYI